MLDGTWVGISGEREGQAVDLAKSIPLQDVRLEISGNSIVLHAKGRLPEEWQFTVDDTRTPREIDITSKESPGGQRFTGVYERSGDTLRICIGTDRGRPKDFTTRPGDHAMLFVLKRQAAD